MRIAARRLRTTARLGAATARRAVATIVTVVTVVTVVTTATGVMVSSAPLTAAGAPIRLVAASARGNAVVIEATDPVAYTVTRPEPLTLVVDLRDVQVGAATSSVQPEGVVSAMRFEQAQAPDGVIVARIRLTLARATEYSVKSARNTIRVELAPATAAITAAATLSPLPPAVKPAAATPKATPTGATRPAAARSGAAQAPGRPASGGPVDAMAALRTVPGAPLPRPAAPAPKAQATATGPVAQAPVTPPPAPARVVSPEPTLGGAATAPASALAPSPLAGTESRISNGQEKKYTGHPISMDFQGVDLRSVLRTFAEISGLNMVIDPDVQGSVDIVLTDVAWDQALEVILRGNSLDYTVDGTIVRIAKIETLQKEQDARRALAQSSANAGALSVRTYTLSYAKADQAAPLVRTAVLSPRGTVQTDARTNTLIITDLPARLDTVTQLLTTLDRAEPQVEIEARIITTTREFARALGVQWGFNGRVNSDIGNTPGLAFPNNGSLGGRSGAQGPGGSDVRAGELDVAGTAVNLGVGDATSAVGLALGAINGAFNLDVALSALERTGKGRVLSTPRVTTQNNVEAEITQGVQIPVQTVANETVTVTFKDAALTLKVTPQITAANTVIMQITVENASPGALVATGTGNIPSIDTQRAITRVQVSDGMTTVMGGIFISREQDTHDKTPFMNRIPFLGWLFKRDSQVDESRELLIFITPRIQRG